MKNQSYNRFSDLLGRWLIAGIIAVALAFAALISNHHYTPKPIKNATEKRK